MNYLHTLASRPLEILLTACLVLFVLVSVRTLRRALRVLRNVLDRGGEPAAELWSRTQVRIEWCILVAQAVTLALSIHRVTSSAWDDSRDDLAFQTFGVLRVVVSALLVWCVLANKRTCETLQAMSHP